MKLCTVWMLHLPLSLLSFKVIYQQWKHTTLFTEPQYNYDHLDKDNYNKIHKIIHKNAYSRNYMPYRKVTNTSRNIQHTNELFEKMVSLNNQIMENIQKQEGDYNDDEDEPLIINITTPHKKSKNGFLDENGIFRYYRPSKKGSVRIGGVSNIRKTDNFWEEDEDDEEDDEGRGDIFVPQGSSSSSKNEFSKENNFQVVKQNTHTFKNIGGYDNIKKELLQISDILLNYPKYKKYNVRTPKGLILDGPPGNGKTLIAKCFSGEIQIAFIQCSGAEFSDKYVGVGASRIRELFDLAEKNKPCIIFIDEVDALARKRGNDMVNSNSEKDQTLNQLLVCMDGFKELSGVFVIGATNRIDMLDEALLRPGRIDKHIYIGNPDKSTRNEILKIHLKGKPIEENIKPDYLIELTSGFSGSQIENLLNEAMLKSLRENRIIITMDDLEQTANRIISGFQGLENKYSPDMIRRIIIHELGHAIIGLFSKEHPKLTKVCINLWSPKTPGYTIFETTDEDNNIHTKEGLFAHLTVLFSGRIAEEFFYGDSITTGARQDLEQAHNLANDMILKYGMGKQNVYPYISDKYKNIIDEEINDLLSLAAIESRKIISNSKNLILDCCEILKRENKLFVDQIVEIVDTKYPYLWDIYKTHTIYK